MIPKVLFFEGLFVLVGSFLWGRIYDATGWRLLLSILFGCYFISHLLLYIQLLNISINYENSMMMTMLLSSDTSYVICGCLFGIGDSINYQLTSSTIIKLFHKESVVIFAFTKGMQSMATSFGFILAGLVGVSFFQILLVFLLVTGSYAFVILNQHGDISLPSNTALD